MALKIHEIFQLDEASRVTVAETVAALSKAEAAMRDLEPAAVLQRGHSLGLVALEGKAFAGYVRAAPYEAHKHPQTRETRLLSRVSSLVVAQAYRGEQLGRTLVAQISRTLTRLEVPEVPYAFCNPAGLQVFTQAGPDIQYRLAGPHEVPGDLREGIWSELGNRAVILDAKTL